MNPISSSSARRLELTSSTSFSSEADGGKALELSMAITVFKKLQDAGFIPPKAKLADDVSSAPGLKSTTWEARLVELIKDADGNGQLDLDLDALAKTLPLTGSPSAAALESTLVGRSAGLPDTFLKSQNERKSELATFRGLTSKGAAVQGYSIGMTLTGEQDRATTAFVDEARTAIAKDSSASRGVASQAIASAQLLTTTGQPARARELLETTADALVEAGRFDGARRVLSALTEAPHASEPRNLIQAAIDQWKARRADFDPRIHAVPWESDNGNKLALKASNFDSTVGEVAKTRLAQVDLRQRMSAVLGRDADPYSMADAGEYFKAFATGKDSGAVAREYGEYLKAFYKHVGAGVEWTKSIPQDERASRLDELLDDQPLDSSFRRVVDCEGFAYLTDRLLGGITNSDGTQRFAVQYATRPGHVITGVLENGSKQLFTVNNDAVSAPAVAKSAHEQQERIARELCGAAPDIIRISRSQTDSQASASTNPAVLGEPKPGSIIWDGARVGGTVNEATQARYRDYAQRTLNANYNGFVLKGGR